MSSAVSVRPVGESYGWGWRRSRPFRGGAGLVGMGLGIRGSRWRAQHRAAAARLYLRELGQLVNLRLERDRDRALVADQPDVVVEGARGVVEVTGLQVQQVAAQGGRQLL